MHVEKRTYSCGPGVYEHPDGRANHHSNASENRDSIHRATEKHTVYVLIDAGRRVDGFLTQWAANRALKGLPRIARPIPAYKRPRAASNARLLAAPQNFGLTGDGEHARAVFRKAWPNAAVALCEARYRDWLKSQAAPQRLAA